MEEKKKKITYDDIKKAFSPEDLTRYNMLVRELLMQAKDKDNGQLWDAAQPGEKMRETLDALHELRSKYDFLKGEIIFRVWTVNIKTKQREELTW